MNIWTQRARLGWKQSVSFYEHRFEVLRRLEDDGSLRRFQERGGQISMRLGGAHQLVSFGPTGLSMATLKPGLDDGVMRNAIEVVCSALEPQPVGRPSFGLQWLVPIDLSYDDARKTASTALFSSVDGHLADFALLLDGTLDEPLQEYQVEVGILEASEVPARLARVVGRVGPADQDIAPALWQSEELPKVALFCDMELKAASIQGDIVENLFAMLESACDSADLVVSSFSRQLGLAQP
jgi:hypothetical protein